MNVSEPLPPAFSLNRRGISLAEAGDWVGAQECFRQAIETEPASIELQQNLGRMYLFQGRLDEAFECCNRILAIDPQHLATLNNLGNLLMSMGRAPEAFATYQRAINLSPHVPDAWNNFLLHLNYVPQDRQALFEAHSAFGRIFDQPREHWLCKDRSRRLPGKLRLGYVSADFKEHAVMTFFEPVLAEHDRSQFEIFCYDNSAQHDRVTERLKSCADHWRPIQNLDDDQAARLIHHDGIDVLIDLSGHTGGNRLPVFGRKPAPIQISWLGYLNTTGMKTMDYHITDRALCPEGSARFYTEALVYLSRAMPLSPLSDAPEISSLPAFKNGFVTFGAFNNFKKASPVVVTRWARIMARVPDSRIMISVGPTDPRSPQALRIFVEHGIHPERVEFVPMLGRSDFFHLIGKADLALDPFPYTGGAATAHTLFMGVPVVTLEGASELERNTAGFLRHAQLENFVAHSMEEYEEKAIAWAYRVEELAVLRPKMRERCGFFADQPARTVKDIEDWLLGY